MVDNRLAGRRDRCSAPQHARGAIKLSGGSGPMPKKAGQLVRAWLKLGIPRDCVAHKGGPTLRNIAKRRKCMRCRWVITVPIGVL